MNSEVVAPARRGVCNRGVDVLLEDCMSALMDCGEQAVDGVSLVKMVRNAHIGSSGYRQRKRMHGLRCRSLVPVKADVGQQQLLHFLLRIHIAGPRKAGILRLFHCKNAVYKRHEAVAKLRENPVDCRRIHALLVIVEQVVVNIVHAAVPEPDLADLDIPYAGIAALADSIVNVMLFSEEGRKAGEARISLEDVYTEEEAPKETVRFVSELLNESEVLKADIKDMEQKVESLTADKDSLSNAIEKLNEDLELKTEEISGLKEEVSAKIEEITALSKESEAKTKENTTLTESLTAKTTENEELSSMLKEETAKSDDLAKKLETKTTEGEKLKKDLETKTSESEKLSKDLETKTSEGEKLTKELEAKTAEGEDLTKKLEAKTAEGEKLAKQLEAKTQENEDLAKLAREKKISLISVLISIVARTQVQQ